jgi:YYY domain-containing protein
MAETLSWWLAIEVLGMVSVPLAALVFSRLPDRGWTLTRPLGLLVLGWLVWFPLSLISALPFTAAWILGTFVVFLGGNIALLRVAAIRQALRELVTRRLGHVIGSEVLFAGAFAAMAWERAFTPAVVDTEKFMDVAFLSAIWRAPHLPSPDPWLSGEPINYYYFGHFLVALPAKVLGTVPAVAFNLGIALIFALTAVAVFGVAANIVRAAHAPFGASWLPAAAGLISVAFVLVLGNLEGARVWWEGATKLVAQASGQLSTPWAWWLHRDLWPQYDWWSPSRVVNPPNTINEFPAFSFVLADLHAHVLALPFAALAVALAFNLLFAEGPGLHAFGAGRLGLLALAVTSLAVGGLDAINGWDLPTYLGLLLLALVIQQWLAHGRRFTSLLVLDLIAAGALLVALCVLLYLPFYRGFSSPSEGVGLVPGAGRSPIGEVLAVFGLQLFVVLSLLSLRLAPWIGSLVKREAARFVPENPQQRLASRSDTAVGIGTLLGACVVLAAITLFTRSFTGWTLFWGVLILVCAAALALRLLDVRRAAGDGTMRPSARAELWVWCLAGTAVALVVACELVFLRDVFGGGDQGQLGAAFRMNTVFKLYYQAWLLLGIACGPMLVWLLTLAYTKVGQLRLFPVAQGYAGSSALSPATSAVSAQGQGTASTLGMEHARLFFARSTVPGVGDAVEAGAGRGRAAGPEVRGALRWWYAGGIVAWMAVALTLLGASTVYPVLAVSARTQNFALPQSLDGTAYMAADAQNQGDAGAIAWLNAHVTGDPVIVEAARYEEYTHNGRISAFTGLPTLLGWGGHEVQWRYNWLAQPGRGGIIDQRLNAVTQIYTNPDRGAVLALLHQYSAQYLYVGQAERELYAQADLKRFDTFLRVVYTHGGVTIYAVP